MKNRVGKFEHYINTKIQLTGRFFHKFAFEDPCKYPKREGPGIGPGPVLVLGQKVIPYCTITILLVCEKLFPLKR